MLAIMKSIYDMMGRYTYPCVRDEAPYEHVDKFFQVQNAHKYKKDTSTQLQGLFFLLKWRFNVFTNLPFSRFCEFFPTEDG